MALRPWWFDEVIKSGKLRLLATTGTMRNPDFPDVPTFAEAGLPGMDYEQWFGVMAPKNLPKPIAETLSTAISLAIKTPEVVEKFKTLALEPSTLTPSEFQTRVINDSQRWQKIANEAGIKPAE